MEADDGAAETLSSPNCTPVKSADGAQETCLFLTTTWKNKE